MKFGRGLQPVLAVAAGALLVAGCGEDEAPAEPEPRANLQATIAPQGAAVGGGGEPEAVARLASATSGESGTLIVGSVVLPEGRDPGTVEVGIEIGGDPAPGVESAPVPGNESAIVAACICEIDPDARFVELVVAGTGGGGVPIEARTLAISDRVVAEQVQGSELPAPLVAAAVTTDPLRIESGPTRLIETTVDESLEDGTPLLVIGQVLGAGQTANLEGIQIDAAIDGERLQPEGETSLPGEYSGAYRSEGDGGESLGLTATTASGSAPIGVRAVFACACTVTPGN